MAKKYTFPSGLRLVIEYMPHLRSVTSGIWVNCGSVYEDANSSGVSHFLEHMLFKGTASRSALDIATAMEAVGGILNAFTGKEHTCYYVRSLDEHFALGMDLLADMYQNALLNIEDFEREKNVILEEINMYEDSPDEVAMDSFVSTIFPSHAYGPPIAGTLASVKALTREQLFSHYQRFYTPANTVIAVAGNIQPEQAYAIVGELFAEHGSSLPVPAYHKPQPSTGSSAIIKDIEQSHICLGFPAVALNDPDYYAAAIIVNALGGGASSRLFQEVREKRALAYSAYCYLESYVKSGFIMAYAATNPAQASELIQVMAEQYGGLRKQGLTTDEIQRSKDQIKGNLLLNLESTANVMSKIGRTEIALNRDYNAEETAARLMAVSEQDIGRVINRLIIPDKLVLAQVGPKQIAVDCQELL